MLMVSLLPFTLFTDSVISFRSLGGGEDSSEEEGEAVRSMNTGAPPCSMGIDPSLGIPVATGSFVEVGRGRD